MGLAQHARASAGIDDAFSAPAGKTLRATVSRGQRFGRAAERLYIAQPALSKSIRQLETKLGVPLVTRTTRSVALTAEGEALLEHGRAALDAVAAAAHHARRASRAAIVLTAKSSDAQFANQIAERCAELEPDRPAAHVAISGWGDQTAMLHDGRADAAILRAPFDSAGLRVHTLRTEPRVAVLTATHPVAERKRLRLSELAHEPRPTWPGADQQANAYWTATEGGPPAPEGPTVSDLAQLLRSSLSARRLPSSRSRSPSAIGARTSSTFRSAASARTWWRSLFLSTPTPEPCACSRGRRGEVAESPWADVTIANGAEEQHLASTASR